MERCVRWPGLHDHPTETQLRWFEMSWKEKQPTSAQLVRELLQDCWETAPGDDLMNLTERMSRVSKAVIKVEGGYFKESKIVYYIIPHVLFHSFVAFSVNPQCTKQ